MKNINTLTIIALLSTSFLFAQYTLDTNYPIKRVNTPSCVYNIKPGVSYVRVERAQKVAEKMEQGVMPCSNFSVNYTGFTPEAQAAFQFAVDIWSNSIESTQTISVGATFETAANPNNLGSARPFTVFPLSNNGGPTYYYPSALAEKLSMMDLTDNPFPLPFDSTDIIASFNNTIPWYFGTDANPPANQFDFVSVVLHELGHGLGFSGIFAKTSDTNGDGNPDQGQIRVENISPIYDVFIENIGGTDMLTFPDPSAALFSEFTGNDLYCNSAESIVQNNNSRPRIYAPLTYEPGSSYNHWNENTFPDGAVNSLMTPFNGLGNAIHDPGPSTLGFFKDMGWDICPGALSVDEFSLEAVVLSPNPFKSAFTITLANGSKDVYSINLFDINGRNVISRNQTAKNGSLIISNLENLENALYFVTIENSTTGNIITKKIIKK